MRKSALLLAGAIAVCATGTALRAEPAIAAPNIVAVAEPDAALNVKDVPPSATPPAIVADTEVTHPTTTPGANAATRAVPMQASVEPKIQAPKRVARSTRPRTLLPPVSRNVARRAAPRSASVMRIAYAPAPMIVYAPIYVPAARFFVHGVAY
jgi:hypothetical protein